MVLYTRQGIPIAPFSVGTWTQIQDVEEHPGHSGSVIVEQERQKEVVKETSKTSRPVMINGKLTTFQQVNNEKH